MRHPANDLKANLAIIDGFSESRSDSQALDVLRSSGSAGSFVSELVEGRREVFLIRHNRGEHV
jgi:hypothetical protein